MASAAGALLRLRAAGRLQAGALKAGRLPGGALSARSAGSRGALALPLAMRQRSGMGELKLIHLSSKARAMMVAASVPEKYRSRVLALAMGAARVGISGFWAGSNR